MRNRCESPAGRLLLIATTSLFSVLSKDVGKESVATCKSVCGESRRGKKSNIKNVWVPEEDFSKPSSTSVSEAPRPRHCQPSSTLVVVELKMEATTRLERVKVEGPSLLSTTTTLLVFRVQWILARVEFLPHFWREMVRIRVWKA